MAYIGRRLREAREARGLTQDQLAELVPGMTRNDISAAENDHLSIGEARLERLAQALDISVLELSPAATPDERGLDLQARLTALEDAFEKEKRLRARGARAFVVRLAELEAALELQGQQPGRRGRSKAR